MPEHFDKNEVDFICRVLSSSLGYGAVLDVRVDAQRRHAYRSGTHVVILKLPDKRIREMYPKQTGVHGMSFTHMASEPRVIVINADNWRAPPPAGFTLGIEAYRTYLLNHEVGHALGLHEHQRRTADYCPLMYQQTRGTVGCSTIDLYPTPAQQQAVLAHVRRRLGEDKSLAGGGEPTTSGCVLL